MLPGLIRNTSLRKILPYFYWRYFFDDSPVSTSLARGMGMDAKTVAANPIVTLPIGKSPEGLPIGVQIHSKRWSDRRLLDISELIIKVIGEFEKPTGF